VITPAIAERRFVMADPPETNRIVRRLPDVAYS
jgi:hypothetical protein